MHRVWSVLLVLVTCSIVPGEDFETRPPKSVRFATFNIQELSLKKLSEVDADGHGSNSQLLNCTEILQRIRPDVVLINEIDAPSTPDDREQINPPDNAARMLVDRYLAVGRNGLVPLDFPYLYIASSNTGVPTGHDLDNDGKTNGPADAFGFGRYPGEYGMALLSRFPIQQDDIRTFRKLRWQEMPENLMPDGAGGRPDFYSAQECQLFRLSSKSHWDVPITVNGKVIHFLCSHPTPPVFDGPEDSNGRRNFDEVRLWADYLNDARHPVWIRDDQGNKGGLSADADFVILGDLNAEPVRGDAAYGKRAIELLLNHPRVVDPRPQSMGALEQPNLQNLPGYAEFKTSDFGRLDYVLHSKSLKTLQTGVFWPTKDSKLFDLVATSQSSSDHRLVWLDVQIETGGERAANPGAKRQQ